MTKQHLFAYLLDKIKHGAYDDDYLEKAIAYRALDDRSENYPLFLAHYALHYENYEMALDEAWKAYRIRRQSFTAWRLLRDAYKAIGDWRAYAFFGAMCAKSVGSSVNIPSEAFDENVAALLTRGAGIASYAPLEKEMVVRGESISKRLGLWIGEFLPRYPWEEKSEYRPWVGVFLEQEPFDGKAELLEDNRWNEHFLRSVLAGYTLDIMDAKVVDKMDFHPQKGDKYLLPVAGQETGAQVTFRGSWGEGVATIGKWATNFFRIEEATKITSDKPFVVGRPIKLGHSPNRKKAVIRIMMDALSWAKVKEENYALMPNTMHFFSKGVIFDQCYTAAEYTFPSVANIETGLYTHRHQIIDEQRTCTIFPETVTLTEQMRTLGYYTVAAMGSAAGAYSRIDRGYDRFVSNMYVTPIYVGVERVIEQLEAFSECDQYITVQALNTHPWTADFLRQPLAAETRISLRDRAMATVGNIASPHLPGDPYYKMSNEVAIRQTDRSLKVLYDYLEAHYADDEYVLELYSDHGVSVYDSAPWVVNDHMTNGAMMFRGAGVPCAGIVDELVSSVDAYAIFSKLAGFPMPEGLDSRLPAVFGGTERDVVYSLSLLPYHLLRCSVRDKAYEYRVECKAFVEDECTVSLRDGKRYLHRRDETFAIVDDAEKMGHYEKLFREQFDILDHHDMIWPRDLG